MGAASPFLVASHFRLRADDGGETNATWLKQLDEQWSEVAKPGAQFRMRLSIEETGGANARRAAFTTIQRVNGGAWLIGAEPAPFKLFESPNIPVGEVPTTQQITLTAFTAGFVYDTSTTASTVTITKGASVEYELCLELNSATYGSVYTEGDTVDIAMAYDDGSLLDNYLVLPSFTIGAAPAGFSDLYLNGVNVLEFTRDGNQVDEIYLGPTQVFKRG